MRSIHTRFRAYQLGSPGSSFSHFADGYFTLIEARLNEINGLSVRQEMTACGKETIDGLHITSWDADHCSASELMEILTDLMPTKIECPGYSPKSENGLKAFDLIQEYETAKRTSNRPASLKYITPEYISSLTHADAAAFQDVLYNPIWIDESCGNNNSTVSLFRKGSFNVLSLGDVESEMISARLRRDKYLKREVDVMVLAHHGADNGFTNKKFLQRVEPQLAICSSDYSNQYDHPTDEIRELLHEQGIRLMTTKTGDVVVHSQGLHDGHCRAINLRANSTEVSSVFEFESKKKKLLSYNPDTLRQLYSTKPGYRRL